MSAIIFPGQGSQYSMMALDFNDNFLEARNVFEQIEDITNIDIRKIIYENQQDKLNQTQFTQILIFACSMAIYQTLIRQIGIGIINPEIVLGHSLGEYSALVANNTLSLGEASKLIKIRGDLMQSAIEPNTSGMAAVIGKNAEFVDEVIKKNNLDIEIANDNSPMQIVISGLIKNINAAENIFISSGVKRYVKLNVSAAFHSKYMNNAQSKLIYEIDKANFKSPDIPIISNYNAEINSDLKIVVDSLKKQMSSKVKWTESINKLEKMNIIKIIEIGPGKILSGLILRISKKFDIISIDKIADLEKLK